MTSQIGRTDDERRLDRRVPPQRMVDTVNPVVRTLAASPAHHLVDRTVLVLHVVGRRTGHRYDIPVTYVDLGSELHIVTQHRWRRNLAGGVDLDVTVHGRQQRFHADLDEHPAAVAGLLAAVIDRLGWRTARHRLGLRTSDSQAPTIEELTELARTDDLAVITLTSDETWRNGRTTADDPTRRPVHWFGERAAARYRRWSR